MSENPVTAAATAPVRGAKGLTNRFKGLPPWVYIGAVGVGVGVIWYVMHQNQSAAAATVQDQSGINPDTGFSYATGAGDAIPGGAIGGAVSPAFDSSGSTTSPQPTFDDWLTLIEDILPTGGGTQADTGAADHYTPPAITVNIPAAAIPIAPVQPTSKPASVCPPDYPHQGSRGGAPGIHCYKCVMEKNGSITHVYRDGGKVGGNKTC